MAAPVQIVIQASDQASASLTKIGDSLQGLATKASAAGQIAQQAIGVALGGGITALAGKLAEGARSGFDFNSSMEQVNAKLNAFTKDGAASAEILEMIRKRAAATPFAFEEMANATTALLPAAKASGQGLETLIGQAEILAALNPAQGLEGAAIALRAATSGDFTSAMERFDIPREIINRLKAEGVPNAQLVGRALQEMGMDASLVSNMAQTMSGRWSTFQDTLVGLASQLSQPIFDAASAGLGNLQTAIDANMPSIQAFVQGMSQGIGQGIQFITGTVLPAAIAGWNQLTGVFGQVQSFLQPVIQIFADLPKYIQEGALQGDVMGFILLWAEQATNNLGALKDKFVAWAGEMLPPFMAKLAEVGTAIVTWIGEQAPGFMAKLDGWKNSFLDWIGPLIPPFMAKLGEIWVALENWLVNTALPKIVEKLGEWGTAFVEWIGPLIPPFLAKLGELAGQLWNWITVTAAPVLVEKLQVWGAAFVAWAAALWAKISVELVKMRDSLGTWLVYTAAPVIATKAQEVGTGILTGIKAGIANGWEALKGFVGQKAGELLDAAKGALGIKSPSQRARDEIGVPLMQGLAQGISDGSGEVITVTIEALDELLAQNEAQNAALKDQTTTTYTSMKDEVIVTLDEMRTRATELADQLKGAIVSKASEAKNDALAHIRGVIEGLSGQQSTWYGAGQTLGEALRNGVTAGLSGLMAALLAQIDAAANAARDRAASYSGGGGGSVGDYGGLPAIALGPGNVPLTTYNNSYSVTYNSAPPSPTYDFAVLNALNNNT